MTAQDLNKAVEVLEQKLDGANCATRLRLQPELSHILARMKAEGRRVPLHLRHLDAALCEEAVEARFDNMPV